MHAPREVCHALIAIECKKRRDLLAAATRATDTENCPALGDLIDSVHDFCHREQHGVWKCALFPLIGLTHIQKDTVVLLGPEGPLFSWNLFYRIHCDESYVLGGDEALRPALHSQPPHPWRKRIDIAVLVSGSGTNLQALIDTADIRPAISVVISDNPDAAGLRRAEKAGIPTVVVAWGDHPDRASFSTAVADEVEAHGAKAVVMAGFMRVLSPQFIERFPNRILNIHPSVLPAFPGSGAVQAALERGVTVTGVTVHLVDEKVDHGPIVFQRVVSVEASDTVETLHARIQVEEHEVYPKAVRALLEGRLSVEAGRVVWS